MKHVFYGVAFWTAALAHAQQCGIVGQVFFADVVDHAITVKTDSGDLVKLSYDGATSFVLSGSGTQLGVGTNRVAVEQLNNGDRLCVGTSEPLLVTVTPRQALEAEQKTELAAWQADSLYGVASGLDRKAQRLTLTVSARNRTTAYSVDVDSHADYWSFPGHAIVMSEAVRGSLEGITSGDTLYVRGKKVGEGQHFVATLIVSGGFRSFAATIETMDILDEMLRVRLVLSGNTRTVHVALGELYAVGRAKGAVAGNAPRLYPIDAADLQPGDTVLILGIGDRRDSIEASALIAGFSPFGVLPPDPSEQMRWIFDNVPLGDPFGTPRAERRPVAQGKEAF
jgi:hypothetical protein